MIPCVVLFSTTSTVLYLYLLFFRSVLCCVVLFASVQVRDPSLSYYGSCITHALRLGDYCDYIKYASHFHFFIVLIRHGRRSLYRRAHLCTVILRWRRVRRRALEQNKEGYQKVRGKVLLNVCHLL